MSTDTDTDPISDLIEDVTGTEVVQVARGKVITWGVQVLDPTAALEVPEILDRLLLSARKVLAEAPAAHENPAMAEALKQVRARDAKGRHSAPPADAHAEAIDVMKRLQRIAMRAVVSMSVDGQTQPCRLVERIEQQTPRGDVATMLGAGHPRQVWVGILDRAALQAIYLSAAVRIEEAISRLARFPGRTGQGVDARQDGAGVQHPAKPDPQPAVG